MTINWGGSREGSGRKKLSNELKKKGYTFQLSEDEIKFIETFDGSNRSESLRNLLDEYKILKKKVVFSRCK